MTYASADPGRRDFFFGGEGKDAADGWAHDNGASSIGGNSNISAPRFAVRAAHLVCRGYKWFQFFFGIFFPEIWGRLKPF